MNLSDRKSRTHDGTPGRTLNQTFTKSRIRKSFHVEPSAVEEGTCQEIFDDFKRMGITEINWKPHRVNALYGFSCMRTKLHDYHEILADYVRKALHEKVVHVEFVLTFEALPENKNGDQAIKVTLKEKKQMGESVAIDECFIGFLLSVERKKNCLYEQRRQNERAAILPLLLLQSTDQLYEQCFIDFLEENFSCFVSPLNFSPIDLKWMLTLFSVPLEDGKKCSTILEYETSTEALKYIELLFDPSGFTNVWKQTIDPSTTDITEDDVLKFISKLESIYYETFKFHLSNLRLCAIRTPLAQVFKDHSFMIFDSKKSYCVLKHLTHLAQELVD